MAEPTTAEAPTLPPGVAVERRDPDSRPARIDSRPETYKHIQRVQQYIGAFVMDMILRGQRHDQSKLSEPELALFDEWTPRLSSMTFGSADYKAAIEHLKPALTHHYANNSHHPEHYPDGIRGMNLMDVAEMFCDWKAASERHHDGNILTSIIKQQERYRFSDELKQILINTIPLFERTKG